MTPTSTGTNPLEGPAAAAFDASRVLAQLRLPEKAALLCGVNNWFTASIQRRAQSVDVPSVEFADGPHGLRRESGVPMVWVPASAYPTASALAASWDRELIGRVAAAIGQEAISQGAQVVLGPGVNMKRSPLCGRNFEYYAEDPQLAGELASSYVTGLQSMGVGACLKHFAANNQELERTRVSVVADERALREIYLAAFERVVKRADPWTVMCSYNRLFGVHASESRWLLTEVL
ncbi:MAG: glycoside hydrolase family 3 protein, partial [Candidatus Nanopelagicales bacterium]